MRRSKIFWRTVFISSVIFGCLSLLLAGISVAFENIKSCSEAKFISAVEIKEDSIRFLDFEIPIKNE